MKKKLTIGFFGMIALLTTAAFASAYIYIQSSAFRSTVETTLSGIIGAPVDIGQNLQLKSFFPLLEIEIEDAKLNTTGNSSALNRARLQNLQASVSYRMLFSGGTDGKLRLKAGSLSVLTRSQPADASQHHNAAGSADAVHGQGSIQRLFAAVQGQLSGLDIEAQIAEFNLFQRDEQSGNSAYHLSDVVVSSHHAETVTASASVRKSDDAAGELVELNIRMAGVAAPDPDGESAGDFILSRTPESESNGPNRLSGEWQIEANRVRIDNVEYRSNAAWLRGDASMTYSAGDIALTADLELRQWDIPVAATENAENTDDSQAPRIFSYDLFTSNIPGNLTADVALYLGAVRLHGVPLVNGQLTMQLADSIVDIAGENLNLLGGSAELSLQVDSSQTHFMGIDLKLEADDVQLERLRSSTGGDTILSRGEADMIIALRGAGPSPAHIASSLDGYVIAAVNAAQVRQKYSTLLDLGVVRWAVDELSLIRKEDDAKRNSARLSDPLTIECASLRLYINDGRVEVSNGAIVELPDNILFSSGYIDLKTETMGFAFRTKGRSLFDWSAISIAKFAEIGGFLGKPSITLNPRELAKQGVMSASSLAWGPLPSLVYSLAESGIRNSQSAECTPQID